MSRFGPGGGGPGGGGPGGGGPGVSFEHVFRLSDDTGLLEHAKGAVARRECGYCLDDVARGLLALSRQPEPSLAEVDLASRYLTFVAHAQTPAGTCHNRFGYDRRWTDRAGTGDWWGRALWSLGSVVSGSGPQWHRDEAAERFVQGSACRSTSLRAMSFAALGAVQMLRVGSAEREARALLADFLAEPPRAGADRRWPWPEPRLTYANATIPEARVAAGAALGDDASVVEGLALLGWLVELQTLDGRLSPVPASGYGPGEARPGFDQQPIEIAALADACATAFDLTGDGAWLEVVARCVGWFLGDNDAGVAMHDPATGGGYDGLRADGPNTNQGAESTLAWLLTQQHEHRFALTRRVAVPT